jgi:hypothetical protein
MSKGLDLIPTIPQVFIAVSIGLIVVIVLAGIRNATSR